jgi:hypothetical protein
VVGSGRSGSSHRIGRQPVRSADTRTTWGGRTTDDWRAVCGVLFIAVMALAGLVNQLIKFWDEEDEDA